MAPRDVNSFNVTKNNGNVVWGGGAQAYDGNTRENTNDEIVTKVLKAKIIMQDNTLLSGSAYIRKDGTTTTTAVIPFASGISVTNSVYTDNIEATGKFLSYLGQVTASNGVPVIIARADFVNQSAALNSETLFAPPASGFYRVSAYARVTQAASTSSVLMGSNGITLSYTDPDDETVITKHALALSNQDGNTITTGTGNTGNTTGTISQGSAVIYAWKDPFSENSVIFDTGYTSAGATPMEYSIHLQVEWLGQTI